MPAASRNADIDGLCSIHSMSQIVTENASLESHNLCVVKIQQSAQTVTMDDDSDLAAASHLRAWREFRGMTQAELAEAVGTNHNMIGYLENGKRGLSLKWLLRLAPVLKTTPGMLLDHDPYTLDADLIEIWVTASLEQRKTLADVAKAVVRNETPERNGTNG